METLREMQVGADALGMLGNVVASSRSMNCGAADHPRRHPLGAGRVRGRTCAEQDLGRDGCRLRQPSRWRVSPTWRSWSSASARTHRRSTTGEFRDRSTLGLMGRQQELLEAVVATGTRSCWCRQRAAAIDQWAATHCAAVCSRGSRATPV
jgi:hypothetical protein